MAEFAAASSVVGIVSLGVQLCNGLVRYYSSYRDSDELVRSMLDASSDLTKSMVLISSKLADNNEIPVDTQKRVESCLLACENSLGKLEKKLDKVKLGPSITSPTTSNSQSSQSKWGAKLTRARRQSLYPFKESTIMKLKELCNDCRNELQVALEILNIDLTISTLSKLDDLSLQVVEIADGVRNVKAAVTQTSDGLSTVVHHQRTQEVLQATEWLSPLQGVFQQRQQEYFHVKGRQDRCGKHLIQTDAFQAWTSQPGQILWCVGAPGIGKTVTASFVVDHLQHVTNQGIIGIAYAYCSYKDTERETALNLISNILQQLLHQVPSGAVGVLSLFHKHTKQKTRPTLSEILDLLRIALRELDRTYIVIDALDECSDVDENRDILVDELTALHPYINLLFVSRPLPHLEQRLGNAVQIELKAHDEDIVEYVKARIALSRRMNGHMQKDPNILETITRKILDKVKGMFLMARLYLDSLISLSTLRRVKETLDTLPNGLTEVYDGCLDRIRGQVPDDADLAIRTLHWIVHAVRPLTLREIQCALAIQPGDSVLNEDGEPDEDLLISACAGLVVIEKSTQTVTLVHYTAQEYLVQNPGKLLEGWEFDLSQTCLTHLLFENLADGPATSDADLETKLALNPLLHYTARYWGMHVHQCIAHMPAKIMKLATELLKRQERVETIYQISEISGFRLPGYSQIFTKGANGLSLAASLGLVEVVSALLEEEDNYSMLSSIDSEGRGPVHHAIIQRGGSSQAWKSNSMTFPRTRTWNVQNDAALSIVKILLAAGASSTAADAFGQTPLHFAAASNRTSIISELIENGASESVRTVDGYNGTPLYRAVEAGQLAAVRTLLDLNSDVFVQNTYNQTVLHRAAEENYPVIAQLLIDHVRTRKGEEEMRRWVGLKDWYGWTAMYRAADHGYTDMAKMLSVAARPQQKSPKAR